MSNWEEKRLGKVAPFKYGKAMTADKRIFGDFNVFSSAGICGKSKMYLAKHGIIIGRKGSVGTVYYSDSPFFCIDTAFYIDEIDPQCSMKFLYYYMKLLHLENYNNDAAVPGLNRNLAEKLKISCPDLPTQNRIADILSTYDDLIEANNRRIELLEQAAQELYKEWFVRLRFPGHEKAKFENGLPEGWKRVRLSEIIDFNPTIKATENHTYKTIPMAALSTETMIIDETLITNAKTLTGSRSCYGDTLLARITPCLENGKTGFVQCLNEGEVAGGSTEFIVMRSKKLNPYLVYFIARDPVFREYAIASMNGADGRQRVKIDRLEKLHWLLPPENIINVYGEKVECCFDLIYQLTSKNRNLAAQRDLLLPRLMSGKLEV